MTTTAVTPITSGQRDQVAKLAADKGISSEMFQVGLDDGTIARALDAIKKKMTVTEAEKILAFVRDVNVGAVEKFVAKDVFTTENKNVKFWGFGSNFENAFLGKVETNVPAMRLSVHTLTKSSRDAGIRAEIGEAYEETTLAYLYELLKAQPRGEKNGSLLVNGYANIFYIKDANGTLWAVDAYWSAGRGWFVGAYSVGYPDTWYDGCQVFSRKSAA